MHKCIGHCAFFSQRRNTRIARAEESGQVRRDRSPDLLAAIASGMFLFIFFNSFTQCFTCNAQDHNEYVCQQWSTDAASGHIGTRIIYIVTGAGTSNKIRGKQLSQTVVPV